jgi:trk system potassium uptake protein TrkH
MGEIFQGFRRFVSGLNPVRAVTLGYLSYVIVGWVLLCLPFAHATRVITGLDALFTATSALSTTGLTTVSTGNDYNLFGQIIIVLLIQLGGIGYMTFGSFVMLSRSSMLSERRRQIGETVFSMPREFRIDKFIRSVVTFTLITEASGAIALFLAFTRAGISDPLWSSIFHAVSAFCTAGFSLYDTSFVSMRSDFWINSIIGILSYLGAIGFIVFVDAWRTIIGKTSGLTLTSKVILVTTLWLSVIGFFLFFIGEPSITQLPLPDRLLASAFQVMTAITTVGFNTIDTGALSHASLFLVILLMVIGASPSGTGGGLKTTTFSALFGIMRSAVLGRKKISFWGRPIPEERVRAAVASFGFYVITLILGSYLLALTESFGFEKLIFEAASALGTVGLSTGITAQLSAIGKLIIVFLMFVGRLGPLVFGIALFLPSRHTHGPEPDDLAV